jgi:hypothetical protein
LGRKPDKRDRKLRRWREERADATAIPADADKVERRPLTGLEDRYEITRTGHVWSLQLRRFIKHKYDPLSGRTYISVTVAGKRESRSVWRAVADSWLTADERISLLRRLPREIHGNAALLRPRRSEIAAISRALNLPYEAIFFVFLEADSDGSGS